MREIKLFACPTATEFTTSVCKELGKGLGKIEFKKFKNDNNFIQVKESVRGRTVFIFQTTEPPVNERVMELLIAIDALKRAAADKIVVVLPYFPYARSDKKDQPRIAVTAKLMAKMLEVAGADWVISCDMHNPAIQSYFEIGCDQLTARYTLEKYFAKKGLGDLVIVATDAGSSKAAFKYASFFNCPVALIDKRRDGNDDNAIASNVIGKVKGRNALIFDDEVDTAGSLVETAKILEREGVKAIYAGCSHGVLSADGPERVLSSPIKELVITDTVPLPINKQNEKIKTVSVAPIFAEAIKRIIDTKSLIDLK